VAVANRVIRRQRPILWALCGAFALVFAWSAYAPVDREDWWMENILVFMVLTALVICYRRLGLSDLSYFLIFCFLCLHEAGAYYTYDDVPFGYWLKDTFHLRRNDYDRIVHFSFGLCWAYPARQMLVRLAGIRGLWSYISPISLVLSASAIYEIIEAYVAQLNPGEEERYVGMQGDVFDSQRDMTWAMAGAIICMALTVIVRRRRDTIPFRED